MKRISWIVVFAVSFGIVGSSSGDDGKPDGTIDQLVLAPPVSDNLALFFSQFQTELVLCLEGERRGNILYIEDFRVPHILLSETGRVQASGCKRGDGTVGTWHNHPVTSPTLANSSPQTLARNCYLSRTDVKDFLRRTDALVSVVSCGPRTFAYWWRQDVEDSDAELALLPAPEGQLVQSGSYPDHDPARLTQARSR